MRTELCSVSQHNQKAAIGRLKERYPRVARFYHNLVDCIAELGVQPNLPDAAPAEVQPRYATI